MCIRDRVWLATDEDREGEAIAWHLTEALKLQASNTKRIVFHEITKDAIQNAVQHPRPINQHLVDAQQARRVLDRLLGYELSPILWRKVKGGLSAGRVQSVSVRIIVEREREIESFTAKASYKIQANFLAGKGKVIKASSAATYETAEDANNFLSQNIHFCKSAFSKYTQLDFINLVKKHSIEFHEKKLGQLFCNKSAKDIIEMLISECKKQKVKINNFWKAKKIF